MNAFSKIAGLSQSVVGVLLSALLLTSCEKPFEPQEAAADPNAFRIVSSQIDDISFKGGQGIITLSDAPESVVSEQDWVTVSTSGTTINVTVAPNTMYDSRTTKILIKKGQTTLSAPITQLGTINVVSLKNMDFLAIGGTQGFDFKPGEDYSLTGFDNIPWLTYEIKNDSIFFTALENGLYDPSREATGHLTVGSMIDTDITVTQAQYELAYDMIPGTYRLEYVTWVGNAINKIDNVTIWELDKGKNLLEIDLPNIAIVATFDPENLEVNIKSQSLIWNSKGYTDIWLSAWEGMNSGMLWPNSKFGIRGVWDGNKQFPTFTYEPDGVTDSTWISDDGNPVITRGFILWGESEVSDLAPSRIINPVLIRVGDLPE